MDNSTINNKLTVVADSMKRRGFDVTVVGNKEQALSTLIELIPEGSSIMNGSSTTLIQIGFIDYMESKENKFNNLHELIMKENDQIKRGEVRRKVAFDADYFLASSNAVTEDGIIVSADATGTRIGEFPYFAKHLVLVIGQQKITKSVEAAMRRVREVVFPLEDARMKKAGYPGSALNKWAIIERETVPHRIIIILVRESLGF